MHAKDPICPEEDAVDVRDWLGEAFITGRPLLPPTGGYWPAVLDGEPFPLEAAVLGFQHAVSPGPSAYPEPVPFCTMDEQLRARRVATEIDAEMRGSYLGGLDGFGGLVGGLLAFLDDEDEA